MSKELITTQIKVKDNLVSILRVGDVDYISLTDLQNLKMINIQQMLLFIG